MEIGADNTIHGIRSVVTDRNNDVECLFDCYFCLIACSGIWSGNTIQFLQLENYCLCAAISSGARIFFRTTQKFKKS